MGPCTLEPPAPTEHLGLGLAEHGGCGGHHWRAAGCGAARPGCQPPQRQALLRPQICKRPPCSTGPLCNTRGAGQGGRCVLGSVLHCPTHVCACHVCACCALPTWAGAPWWERAVVAASAPGMGPLGLGSDLTRGFRDPRPHRDLRGSKWIVPPCAELCLAHSLCTKPTCCPAALRGRRVASQRCRGPGSTARW